MKIAIGSDHRGVEALEHIARRLKSQGHDVALFPCAPGESCDYPDNAWQVASAVAAGEAKRGVLICGSGIGMSIAANKVKGVRAALVHDELTAQMSRAHNDANVLCIPGDLVGLTLVDKITDRWLDTPFEGGRHARRVNKLSLIEQCVDPAADTASNDA